MNYQPDDDGIETKLPRLARDRNVTFRAEDIHRERTGIHAKLSISIGVEVILAWSTLNIEKDDERTRLANSANRRLNPDDAIYTKEHLKLDLDEFCGGLWHAHISTTMPEPTEGDDKAISFLLEPLVVEGGGTMIYAPPGAGKSNTAIAIAVSIDAGTNNLWHVKQIPTAFINLERSAQSLRNRLGAMNVALGLPRSRPLVMLNARGRTFSDLEDSIKEAVKKYHIGFGVLDSISRGGFGDLNENQPVNRAVDSLNKIFPSWLALGHTPRSDESHIFGGVHHEAGADVMVQLTRQQEPDNKLGVALEITKANDFGQRPKIKLAMEFGERGLTAIRRAETHEFVKLDMKRKPDMKDALMDYLLDTGDATASQLAKELGYNRVNVSTMLRHDLAFVETRREKQNVFYGVKVL